MNLLLCDHFIQKTLVIETAPTYQHNQKLQTEEYENKIPNQYLISLLCLLIFYSDIDPFYSLHFK